MRTDNPLIRFKETCEHAVLRIGTLRTRVYELRPPLVVPVSGEHNSQRIHCRALTIDSKDSLKPAEHRGAPIEGLRQSVYELRPPLDVPVSGGHNP